MPKLTVFLARLIGLSTVLLVVALFIRGGAVIEASVADQPLMLTYAITSLAIGLAIVLGHNIWKGLPAIVVSLVGWLILAKGLLLLFAPAEALTSVFARMHYGDHMFLYLAPSFLIGLYLTWSGFVAPASRA